MSDMLFDIYSASSSSFPEVAFCRLPFVKWSPLETFWSPKRKAFQSRTPYVTVHEVIPLTIMSRIKIVRRTFRRSYFRLH